MSDGTVTPAPGGDRLGAWLSSIATLANQTTDALNNVAKAEAGRTGGASSGGGVGSSSSGSGTDHGITGGKDSGLTNLLGSVPNGPSAGNGRY